MGEAAVMVALEPTPWRSSSSTRLAIEVDEVGVTASAASMLNCLSSAEAIATGGRGAVVDDGRGVGVGVVVSLAGEYGRETTSS
jgi:hypothetical protein